MIAQDSGRPSDRALAPLVACRPIADPRARALCYDGALDRLQRAVGDRRVVLIDREDLSSDPRFAFGLDGPGHTTRARPARKSAAGQEGRSIHATVVAATATGYGLWTIRLSTGAVWRTIESGLTNPRPGAEVHIRAGVLGGYLLWLDGGLPIRAIRVG